jgi:PIN domain nuclease of toxin-antitoxin system
VRYLLDTHVVLWIGRRSREQLTDPANDAYVSVVSIWEMAVKARIGKLEADVGGGHRLSRPDGAPRA